MVNSESFKNTMVQFINYLSEQKVLQDIKIKDLCNEYNESDFHETAVISAISFLSFLGPINVDWRNNTVIINGLSGMYALRSIKECIRANIQIVKDWERDGVAEDHIDGSGFGSGVDFMYLIESIRRQHPDAIPELMKDFSKEVSAKEDFYLSGNFRSSDHIVNLSNSLLPRTPSMQAVGDNKSYDFEPQWRHISGVFNGLQDYFLPEIEARGFKLGECAVLGPNFFVLRNLARQLREYGIPIIGPGARPYRRSQHLIAPLAEEVCSHLISNKASDIKIIRWRMLDLIINCQMKVPSVFFSFSGDVALTKVLRLADILVNINSSAVVFLGKFAIGLAEIMCEHELLSESNKELLISSGESMVEDIRSHNDDIDVNNFSIEDIGLLAGGDKSLKLLTLHRAKGREFHAVAIIMAHERLIPYGSPSPDSEEENEARRLFYVGITRARKLLIIFTDSNDWRAPSRFLHEIFPNGPTN